MKTTRSYTMTTRAAQAEETRQRILEAAVDLHSERLAATIGLEDVATRAGVSVQTVLRRFGSRAGLLEAAHEFAQQQVRDERATPVGDVAEAVRVLVAHYELRGDTVLMMLAQETTDEQLSRITSSGKQLHRRWVLDVFTPQLERCAPTRRDEAVDLLVVATDVYAWKLLRRDRGLSRAQTEQRITALVHAVLDTAPTWKEDRHG